MSSHRSSPPFLHRADLQPIHTPCPVLVCPPTILIIVLLTAESLIDKSIALTSVGGVFANQRPTEFLCLTLKLLQLQPEKEILMEYLLAEEFK